MARGGQIEIPIAVDTGGIEKSIQNGLIEPVEDAEDALKKLGKADTGDLTRDLKKAGDQTEDLSDELDDVRDDLKKVGYAAKDAGDDTKKGMDRAKDGVKEVGREAESTAKEAAASFDGSAESIGDAFQEVAANAFAGFGPAGVIAGAAAAVGIGAVTEAFNLAEESRKALEERANDLAEAYIEAGTQVLDAVSIAARSSDVLTSTDPKMKQDLQDLTDLLGDRSLAVRVLAGDSDALATSQQLLTEREKDLEGASFAATENTGKRKTAIGEEAKEVENLSRLLGEQAGIQGSAAQKAQDYSNVLLGIVRDAGSASQEVDEFGNKLLTLPSGAQVVIDAETGQATTNVDKFKGDVDGIKENVSTTVKFNVDDSEVRNYVPPRKTANVRYIPQAV